MCWNPYILFQLAPRFLLLPLSFVVVLLIVSFPLSANDPCLVFLVVSLPRTCGCFSNVSMYTWKLLGTNITKCNCSQSSDWLIPCLTFERLLRHRICMSFNAVGWWFPLYLRGLCTSSGYQLMWHSMCLWHIDSWIVAIQRCISLNVFSSCILLV